jgi:cell division initiation protein
MKLTPLDIHHKEFHRSIRGYNEEEVDVFLDEIADEFERLFKENISLGEQIEQLKEKMQQYQTIEATLQNTLFTAQKTAEELRSNAEKEAELMRRDAELKAKDMIQQALAEKNRIQQMLLRIKQSEEEFRSKFKSLLDNYTNNISEIKLPEDVMLLTSAPGEENAAAGTALIIEQPEPMPEPEPVAEVEEEPEPEPEPKREPRSRPKRSWRDRSAQADTDSTAEHDTLADADDSGSDAAGAAEGEEPLLSEVTTTASSDGSVRGLQLGEVGHELGDDIDLPSFLRDPLEKTDAERDRLKKHGSATDLLAGREDDADIEEIS